MLPEFEMLSLTELLPFEVNPLRLGEDGVENQENVVPETSALGLKLKESPLQIIASHGSGEFIIGAGLTITLTASISSQPLSL